MADRVGQQFGSYRLTHLVGRGSFAEVYLGQHMKIKEYRAAIKVVRGYTQDDKSRRDFLREARILAKLKHPHITELFDFDIQGNIPFIVMTYAPYGNLAQKHPLNEPVPLDLTMQYVKQIGSALQHAHEQGIVHCDLKPNNLLIGSDKTLLVSDFGFARLLRGASRSETSHRFGGTHAYCAPEQFSRHPATVSDQYALGVIVYQWLCGWLPFDGTPQQLMYQHLYTSPPSIQDRLPGLAPQIEHVVFKALAKEPQQRFATIQQFVAALEEAAQPTLHIVQTSLSSTITSPGSSQTTVQTLEPTLSRKTPETVPAQRPRALRPLTSSMHIYPIINVKQVIVLLLGLLSLAGVLHLTLPPLQQASDFLGRATMHTQGWVVASKDYQSTGFNMSTSSSCTSVVQVKLGNRQLTIPNEGCNADINTFVTVIYDPHDPQGAKVEFGAQQERDNAIWAIVGIIPALIWGIIYLMYKMRNK